MTTPLSHRAWLGAPRRTYGWQRRRKCGRRRRADGRRRGVVFCNATHLLPRRHGHFVVQVVVDRTPPVSPSRLCDTWHRRSAVFIPSRHKRRVCLIWSSWQSTAHCHMSVVGARAEPVTATSSYSERVVEVAPPHDVLVSDDEVRFSYGVSVESRRGERARRKRASAHNTQQESHVATLFAER